MTDRAALQRVYSEAIFEVDLPEGTVSFGIGDAVAGLAGRSFAVVTAYNPGSERPSREENEAANSRLVANAAERGARVLAARGRDAAGTHIEPSFALFGLSLSESLALAREFRQAAVVWFDGQRARLVWTAEAPPPAGP